MPIGWALTACFAAAVLGLAGLSWIALALLHHPKFPRASTISLHDLINVLQLVFASVAGAGALVALVMTYRRQRAAEVTTEHDRTRMLSERFASIAAQLGDGSPAIRLAGVHAMAGLADDWVENRQTCVDVLCAYLRLPYEPDPGADAPGPERLAFRGNREVRHTVIRLITAHLKQSAAASWQGLDLDFSGAVFDGGTFSGDDPAHDYFDSAVFSGGTVSFEGAEFSGGTVFFNGAVFSGADVFFGWTKFTGARVWFNGAVFSGGLVRFLDVEVTGGEITFGGAHFSGGHVFFSGDVSSTGRVSFLGAADWSHPPGFRWYGPPGPTVELPPDSATGGDDKTSS